MELEQNQAEVAELKDRAPKAERVNKAKGKNTQDVMKKLEHYFGSKSVPVDKIWSIYKSHGYDVAQTLSELEKISGKKVDINEIEVQKPKKSPQIPEPEEPEKKRLHTSEEVYNRIMVSASRFLFFVFPK